MKDREDLFTRKSQDRCEKVILQRKYPATHSDKTMKLLEEICSGVLQWPPPSLPHNPDVAFSNFYVLSTLKESMGVRKLEQDEDVQQRIRNILPPT